jgi:hypothetical protein
MSYAKIVEMVKKNYVAIIVSTLIVLGAVYYYTKYMKKPVEGFEDVVDRQMAIVHPVDEFAAKEGCACCKELGEVDTVMAIQPYDSVEFEKASVEGMFQPATETVEGMELLPVL